MDKDQKQLTVEEKNSFFDGLLSKVKSSLKIWDWWKKSNLSLIEQELQEEQWNNLALNWNDWILKADFFDKLIMKMHAPKLKDKTNFFRLLAVAQKAWLWLMESLWSLKLSEKNKWLYNIICDLMDQLNQWVSLAEAMSNHDWFFSTSEVELVRSSQVSWSLIDTLNQIADQLESSEEIRWKIKWALRYPIILLVVALWASWALIMFVLPNIVWMFAADSLPWITTAMLWVADFIWSWKWLMTWIIVASLIFTFKFMYSNVLFFKKAMDKLVLQIPISAAAIKTYHMYQFAQLLSQFYSAWISPVVSLWLLANIFSNFEYKKKMVEIKKDMESWFTFYESMDWSYLFDSLFIQIMHVWEDTWAIADVLSRIAAFYKNSFSEKMDALMDMLSPLMMCILAWLIWSIVAAIYLPMVSIMDAL